MHAENALADEVGHREVVEDRLEVVPQADAAMIEVIMAHWMALTQDSHTPRIR